MSRSWIFIVLGLSTGVVLSSGPNVFAQGTTVFHIDVPRKLPLGAFPTFPAGPMQIMNVKATVSVASDLPVTFTITDPQGNSWAAPALTPGMAQVSHAFPPPAGSICAMPSVDCFDSVNITPNSNPVGDPNRDRYTMYFSLNSNYEVNNSCRCTQDNPTHTSTNSFTVTVTAGSPKITGVCLESFDGLSAQSCTSSVFVVPLNKPVATVHEFPPPTQGCFMERPAVDVALVLDKSGSMASTTTMGGPTRMDALHTAVRNFVGVWSGLPPTAGDQIGAVVFDTTSPTQPAVPNFPLGLTDMTLLTTRTNVPNWVDTVTPGGATSIGAGLHQADQLFAPNGHRKVVLLMSDGQQNTEPLVKGDGGLYCNNAAVCTSQAPPIPQTCTATNACPLSSQAQIYTVTVGPSGSVDPAIAQAIATGFYLNTEINYPLLSPFFLELLQNFLKFNSYETVRIISEPTPYSAMIPISTTSHNVAFSVMWPSRALLRLTVTPPGGAEPIVRESASGFISVVQQLPLPAPFNPMGDWKIKVEAVNPDVAAAAVTTTPGGVPFDLHVMTDDAAIKTDLAIVPGDYKPGDKIKLRARLTRLGLPIVGLGSHPGNQIEAKLILPGKSIGDILSDSTASAVPSGPDPQTPAEAKLDNTLKVVPSPLVPLPDQVTLYDDGKPEHGDDVAGDGIYSALYPVTLPGHYNFTLAAESVAPDLLRFSRQQLRTVYVRPFPDVGNTVFQTSIFRRDNGNVLSIVMTPRVKPGPGCLLIDPKCGRMGPGWANYFWFTAPGQTPFKAKDNLDGTYTAILAFAGSVPPTVSVHFENVLAVIGDSVPPDKLPDPLGQGNVLTVVPPPCCQTRGRLALFLDAGAGIPHGTFGSAFNTGFSLNAGLEYIATSHFSAEAIFGYHHFPAKVGSAVDLYQFSANGKAYLTTGGSLRPFVNAGIGGYKFSPGSTYFGGNFGAGVLKELNAHWGLQASYNFHAVNTPGAATKFSTVQGGIRYVF